MIHCRPSFPRRSSLPCRPVTARRGRDGPGAFGGGTGGRSAARAGGAARASGAARGRLAQRLRERRLVLRHRRLVGGHLLLILGDEGEGGLATGWVGRGRRRGGGGRGGRRRTRLLRLRQIGSLLMLVRRRLGLVPGEGVLVLGDGALAARRAPVGGRRSRGRGGRGVGQGLRSRGRLTALVLGQFRLVGVERRLRGRDRLAQRRRIEGAERLPGCDLLADGGRHGGHLARHLERGRGVVHGFDGSDDGHALPDVRACHRGCAVARVAATRGGPRRGPAAQHDDKDQPSGHQGAPMARTTPSAPGRARHCHRRDFRQSRRLLLHRRGRTRPRPHRSRRCTSGRRSR